MMRSSICAQVKRVIGWCWIAEGLVKLYWACFLSEACSVKPNPFVTLANRRRYQEIRRRVEAVMRVKPADQLVSRDGFLCLV